MHVKNIVDPLKDRTKSYKTLQERLENSTVSKILNQYRQLENVYRLPEVLPNSSVTRFMSLQKHMDNLTITKLLNQQNQLENVCRLPEVLPNSSVTRFISLQKHMEKSLITKLLNQQMQLENRFKPPKFTVNTDLLRLTVESKTLKDPFGVERNHCELSCFRVDERI